MTEELVLEATSDEDDRRELWQLFTEDEDEQEGTSGRTPEDHRAWLAALAEADEGEVG